MPLTNYEDNAIGFCVLYGYRCLFKEFRSVHRCFKTNTNITEFDQVIVLRYCKSAKTEHFTHI